MCWSVMGVSWIFLFPFRGWNPNSQGLGMWLYLREDLKRGDLVKMKPDDGSSSKMAAVLIRRGD